MKTPRVSIGLPVYNGAEHLRQALDSALNQTYSDFEVIICDNASTDDTPGICQSYVRSDARFHYIRQSENKGVVNNSNLAFEKSKGEYFRWASSDDYTAPTHLETCVEILDEHPQAVLAFTKTGLLSSSGELLRERDENLSLQSERPSSRYLACHERQGLCNLPYGLIRSDALRRSQRFGNYIGSDLDLVLELTLYGTFRDSPNVLFFRRLRPAGAMTLTTTALLKHYHPDLLTQVTRCCTARHRYRLRSILRAPISWREKAKLFSDAMRRIRWDRGKLIQEWTPFLRAGWLRDHPPIAPCGDCVTSSDSFVNADASSVEEVQDPAAEAHING